MGTNSEILARLRSRRRRIEPATLRVEDEGLPVGLVVLTPAEHEDAVLAAAQHFERKAIDPHKPLLVDAWNNQTALQVLSRALVEPEPGPDGKPVRIFKTAGELAESLQSLDALSNLLECYYAHPDYQLRAEITAERLQELAEEVRRSPKASSSCDSATLRRLVLFLAGQPST